MTESFKFIGSAFAAFVSNLVFLGTAYFLDKIIASSVSTFLSLILSTIANFYLQQSVFGGNPTNQKTEMGKFFTVAILNNTIILLLSNYLISKKNYYIKYLPKNLRTQYNTAARTFAGALSFVVIAYPLRRYWVFK